MTIVVVTGASRGIGGSIAWHAHKDGYEVIGLARDPGAVNVPFDLRRCDVSDADQVEEALSDLRTNPAVHALVNAAGISSMNLVVTTPPETMRRIVVTNLLGTMYCSQFMGRVLARRGNGRIINFSTIAVPLAISGEAAYAASKAGVETFSRVLARELSDHGVTVNTLAPGPIDTTLTQALDPSLLDAIVAQQIVRRQASPEDVWNLVAFLLSPRSAMITGHVLHLGGV